MTAVAMHSQNATPHPSNVVLHETVNTGVANNLTLNAKWGG